MRVLEAYGSVSKDNDNVWNVDVKIQDGTTIKEYYESRKIATYVLGRELSRFLTYTGIWE